MFQSKCPCKAVAQLVHVYDDWLSLDAGSLRIHEDESQPL